MQYKILVILSLFSHTHFAFAIGSDQIPLEPHQLIELDRLSGHKKVAVVLGGGGEPDGSATIFDRSLQATLKGLNASQYITTASFNGGHEATEKILAQNLDSKASSFTQANAFDKLDTVYALLDQNKIPPGGQLLIVINSHGAPPNEKYPSHEVATSDRDPMTLASLSNIIDVANKKHIKLAIVDVSCYSGATQELANSNTCVISAASATTVSYTDFGKIFGNEMKPGKSLEEIFLTTRRALFGPGIPEINTPAGQAATDQVRQLRLNIESDSSDVVKNMANCDSNQVFQKNISSISAAIQNQSGMSYIDKMTFRAKLQEYANLRSKAIDLVELGKTKIKISDLTVDFETLASLDKMLNLARHINNPAYKKYLDRFLSHEKELKAERERLIQTNPKFKDLAQQRQAGSTDNTGLNLQLYESAQDIMESERKIFDAKYNSEKTKESKSACSEFIL